MILFEREAGVSWLDVLSKILGGGKDLEKTDSTVKTNTEIYQSLSIFSVYGIQEKHYKHLECMLIIKSPK